MNKDKPSKTKYTKVKTPKGIRYKNSIGDTPGSTSIASQKGKADTRNKVGGYGGGVKRKSSPTLKAASKKTIKVAKKMNQAQGRKYKKK